MKSSGIILAGGKSSRMKFNKAFARITSETAFEILIDQFVIRVNKIRIPYKTFIQPETWFSL